MRTKVHPDDQGSCRHVSGSILVVVLVTIMVAVFALTLFIERARDDLLVETREVDAARLRAEAYSALEVTLCVVREFKQVNGALRSPAEGWSDPLAFAGHEPGEGRTISVEFDDESGKFSLPRMSPSALVDLFVSWEFSQGDAEQLADALLEWCREDHVPASGFSNTYEEDPIAFGAPRRSLRTWSELASVDLFRELFYNEDGRPNERWRMLTDAVSLLDFPETNVNSARPGVLTALGLSPSQQMTLSEHFSMGGGAFSSASEAAALVGTQGALSSMGTEIRALRVIITVREGASVFRLNAVVATPGSGTSAITKKANPVRSSRKAGQDSAAKETGATASEASTPAGQGETRNGQGGISINYPFTVLEIRENDAIPQVVSSLDTTPSKP